MAGATTQAQRQAEVLAAGYNGPLTDAAINQAYANAATPSDLAQSGISNRPVTSSVSPSSPTVNTSNASADLDGIMQRVANAVSAGDQKALQEQIREFDQKFGLDKDQFNEGIRQFNQNYLISQAGLTGTFNGQQTQQARLQAANIAAQTAGLTGYYAPQATGQFVAKANGQVGQVMSDGSIQAYGSWGDFLANGGSQTVASAALQNPLPDATFDTRAGAYAAAGVPTMAREQQTYAQQMGVATLASQLQANPFRQQQVLGQAGRILGGQPVAGFQAPNTVAGVGTAGGNQQGGLGYLQQMIDDIKNPVPNQTTADQFLQQTPTPNKIDSTSFLRAAPSTQNILLQAMQEKYGIDPNDALTQIKNTLPQFQAPTTTFGTIKR
jgi:hypothetical protein